MNKEKKALRDKEYRIKNIDKLLLAGRANYYLHQEKYREIAKQYRQNNSEKIKAYKKEHYNARAAKNRRLVKAYGITIDHYEKIIFGQGGVCAICNRKPDARSLAVDHDHKTGAVRGILCHHCNSILGNSYDDVEILKKSISYLEAHNANA